MEKSGGVRPGRGTTYPDIPPTEVLGPVTSPDEDVTPYPDVILLDLVLTVNSLIYCSNIQSLNSLKSVPLLVSLFQKLFTVRQTHTQKN